MQYPNNYLGLLILYLYAILYFFKIKATSGMPIKSEIPRKTFLEEILRGNS